MAWTALTREGIDGLTTHLFHATPASSAPAISWHWSRTPRGISGWEPAAPVSTVSIPPVNVRYICAFHAFGGDDRSDFIMTMLESRDGTLWIGTTGGGVAELNPTTLKARRYLAASRGAVDAPVSNYVYALMEDRRGRIWIGTWGAGISVLDRATEQFAHLEHIDSLPSSLAHNTIQAFHEDARGTVWIGTAGGGLDAFNPSSGTFEHFIEADGLPNNVVYGILEDAEEIFGSAPTRAFAEFDPQSRTMRNFTTSDGLQSLRSTREHT